MNGLLSRPASKRVLLACIAVLLFAGVVAVATHSSEGIGDARLRTKGHATITSPSGERRTVTGTVALHRGDVVDIVDGEMTIDLPNDATVEGRTGYKGNEATSVRIAQPVELRAGELLVVARNGVDVDAGGNRVRVGRDGADAAARLARTLSVGARVYKGGATLDSAGQTRDVQALRNIEVSSLGRPSSPTPLPVDDDDPWDRRFLGEAIDLGHVLDSYAQGYTKTLGPNTRTPGNYRQLLPSLQNEDAFTADLLASKPHKPGEIIVGAAIAGLGRRGSFVERFGAVFDFHDAGASWGLVALDQGVDRDPLLAEVQHALNNEQFQFADAARTSPTSNAAAPSTTSPTTPGGGGGGGPTTTAPITPPTQPPVPPPTTVPPTGQPLVDGLVDTVNNVLGGLTGGGGGGPLGL